MQNATQPEDFIGMARAYDVLYYKYHAGQALPTLGILPDLICNILAEPHWVDWRRQPATFANGRVATSPEQIERCIKQLMMVLENGILTDPNEFYFDFEEIHPWHDGNGRVGSLLWNLMNGTIASPIHPPQHPSWILPKKKAELIY